MTDKTGSSLGRGDYMPQLDALRFFAVLGVMVVHNWHPRRLPWLLGDLDWAGLGVRLFFALSGFLITGILLDCRDTAERTQQPRLSFVKRFYARRFLRIFPIYYLVLFLAIVLNVEPARELWLWFTTYTTNIYITVFNTWVGRLGHFWTLAVEEQFYFFWPWLVLFLPRRWLVPIMCLSIPIAPLYRFYAYQAFPFDIGAMDFKAGTFTAGSLDSLGAGALLAIVWRSGLRRDVLQRILTWAVLPIGLAIYITSLVLYSYRISPVAFFTFSDLGAAMIFVWLISSAGLGFKGALGRFLELRPLTYLGKITYGIYVYHNLAPLVLIPVFDRLGIPYPVPSFTNFVASSVLTILVASISWRFFEEPINNLKRHFPYLDRSHLPKLDASLEKASVG